MESENGSDAPPHLQAKRFTHHQTGPAGYISTTQVFTQTVQEQEALVQRLLGIPVAAGGTDTFSGGRLVPGFTLETRSHPPPAPLGRTSGAFW